MREQLLSIDKFEKPKEIVDGMAEGILLLRLMLMKPGTIKLAPKMGLDLPNRYAYAETSELDDLSQELHEQISIYLPELNIADISITLKEKVLHIEIDTSTYRYVYDKADNSTISLSNILNGG